MRIEDGKMIEMLHETEFTFQFYMNGGMVLKDWDGHLTLWKDAESTDEYSIERYGVQYAYRRRI